MADNRLAAWKNDQLLEDKLKDFVLKGLCRSEILDFLKREFPQYEWSLRSLDRRLRHFDIYFNDKGVEVEEVQEALEEELQGPGRLLGYRLMHKKLRQKYKLYVSREKVYDVMQLTDPEGLAARGGVGDKKAKKKGNFTSLGPNWVHSLDGHDKLMGYQNSTYPIAVYGCLDTASRKLLWLKVWMSNSDPQLVGHWYLQYLLESKLMPAMLRLDRGTETGTMATIHAYLRRNNVDDDVDPEDTILFGPSTSNQIERWWRELHEKLERFFKEQLNFLKDRAHYNPNDNIDRMLLAFIMIPVVQKEVDEFKDIWNIHRIRAQKDTVLPDGVPNHIFSFPERYGMQECGLPITEEQLHEVAVESGVLTVEEDYLTPEFRRECQRIVDVDLLKATDCKEAFIYLKEHFSLSTVVNT